MATRTTYLTYYIVLTDADQVAAYQALYPKGVNRAPYNAAINGGAAIEFAAPWRGYLASALGTAPYTWTPWSGAGSNAGPYPINVATFTRHTGGFWGIGGTTTKYLWVGQFVLAPQPAPAAPPVAVYLPQRRWAEGFDIPGQICGLATPGGLGFSRDASRHTDGFGLALRGTSGKQDVPLTTFAGLGTPAMTWDRIYVRWRHAGGEPYSFLRWHSAPSSAAGAVVGITPTGQIVIENVSSSSVRSLLGTFYQCALNTWAKLDIITRFNNGAGSSYGSHGAVVSNVVVREVGIGTGVVDAVSTITVPSGGGVTGGAFVITSHTSDSVTIAGTFGITDAALAADANHPWTTALLGSGAVQLHVNGVKVADLEVTSPAGGIGASGQTLASVEVGNIWAINDDTEIDVDDWVSTEVPRDANGLVNLSGVDFTQGSKITVLHPDGFGGAHANWTGDVRVLPQQGVGAWATKAVLTSATSGAVLESTTDLVQAVNQEPQGLGAVAMQVVLQSLRGSTASGTLGYGINGAAVVDTAIVQTATMGPNAIMYRPAVGAATPPALTAILLRHSKAADTSTGQVATLLAMVEIIGVFGAEDVPAGVDPVPKVPARIGVHNAPYARTPWALDGAAAPNAPVIITGGIYTGNGTGQDLSFRAPVHWLLIRNAAGSQPGGMWWSSMLGAHRNSRLGVELVYATRVGEDQTYATGVGEDSQQQRYLVRLAGSDAQVNQNAVTYQYVAVSDPGGRFLLNFAQAHRSAMASAVATLVDPGFTPEWTFFAFEDLTATTSVYLGAKGPGHATESVTRFSGTTVTTALSVGAGSLTGKTAFWALISHLQVAFSCWRRHDGNNDPGEAGVFAIGSYLGDGTATRTLSVGSAGKRPLCAIVVPENNNALVRDPSHTGTTSQLLDGGTANASTGITAGAIDGITVGSVLNSNGVTYHYFILWGGTTAGNGGFSANGEFFPVEAAPPATGPWPADPSESDFTSLPATVGVTSPVGEPDLATACVAETQRLGNIALSRIGVSKVITDLVAENTMEAAILRLHVKTDVEAVLADFPWPFATRYASLVLVAGSEAVPANVDWVYSYRAPTDLVAARRLGGQLSQRRGWDPDPITFRLGSDATGALIYSNAAISTGVPLVLEYTARVSCPASTGSPLFKDALAWRFAASLAMPLARDEKQQAYCLGMYERVLRQAEAVAANEMQQDKRGDADWITGRN